MERLIPNYSIKKYQRDKPNQEALLTAYPIVYVDRKGTFSAATTYIET
jgi:hypothetical protein